MVWCEECRWLLSKCHNKNIKYTIFIKYIQYSTISYYEFIQRANVSNSILFPIEIVYIQMQNIVTPKKITAADDDYLNKCNRKILLSNYN